MRHLSFSALKSASLVHENISVAQDAVQCHTLRVLVVTRGTQKRSRVKRSDEVMRSYKIDFLNGKMLISAPFDEDHPGIHCNKTIKATALIY